jgi:O-antigen/teichoic acid export membrane protein
VSAGGARLGTRRVRGFGATALALVGSGVLLNVLLAVVARTVSTSEYALFSAFWSAALIIGFGVFLPAEQWLVGRVTAGEGLASAVTRLLPVVSVVVAVECVLVLCGGYLLLGRHTGGRWLTLGLIALCLVSAVQFMVRGATIAAGRLEWFSAILLADVLARLGLVVAFSALGLRTAAPYAWAVVGGIALAHLPAAAVLLRRRTVARPATRRARPVRPLLQLMLGSLSAQVLFNGPSVALAALAAASELASVGTFQAAFQLVRVPLFLVVPVQATLVPVMARLASRPGQLARGRFIGTVGTGAAFLVCLGAIAGWVIGPFLVRLVFGARYQASAGLVAVLAAGAAAYLAQVVLTQLLVARRRHAAVGSSWLVGALTAAVVLAVVVTAGTSLVLAVAWCFVVGCVVSLTWALVAASAPDRPAVDPGSGPGEG